MSEYFCSRCNIDNHHPVIGYFADKEGNFLGLKPACKQCGGAVGERVDGTDAAPVPHENRKTAVATPVPAQLRQALTSAMTPGALVKAARQRVRELNALIKDRKALEKERDELQRLIKAAKNNQSAKRVAAQPVRSLRTAVS